MRDVVIRKECPSNVDAITHVISYAFPASRFGCNGEAKTVLRLREPCHDMLSLVAETEKGLVGHVMFSSAIVDGERRQLKRMGLAPMAVLPVHQRKGIGKRLIENELETLSLRSVPFVVVLGHSDYYPRFGFALTS